MQCDRCECWVHQICGLFNKGRNDAERGYLCPHCLLHGEAPLRWDGLGLSQPLCCSACRRLGSAYGSLFKLLAPLPYPHLQSPF